MSGLERFKQYREPTDYTLIRRLPICIELELRNYKKVFSEFPYPYSPTLSECMQFTLSRLVSEIDNSVFGFWHFNQIDIIIIQNNDDVWLNNKIQKISSFTASLATLSFHKALEALDQEYQTHGEPLFYSNCFHIPSISECINHLVLKQNLAINRSLDLNKLNKSFPLEFERGVAAYKSYTNERLRWIVDKELPLLLENKDFLEKKIRESAEFLKIYR